MRAVSKKQLPSAKRFSACLHHSAAISPCAFSDQLTLFLGAQSKEVASFLGYFMTLRLLLLILSSVSLSALAQLALKVGTSAVSARTGGVGGEVSGLLHSPMVYVGLGLYGLGAMLWLFVLGRAPLSLAYPFVGIGFIMTMLAGILILHENVTPARIGGTLLIALGCVLVARSA